MRHLALLLSLLPGLAHAQDVPWIEDPAFCRASIAEWEEREPRVLHRRYLGNHYAGCDWAAPLPDLRPGQRLTIPDAACADNLAVPKARYWRTDIKGHVRRDGTIALRVPGFRPRRMTFSRCPAVPW